MFGRRSQKPDLIPLNQDIGKRRRVKSETDLLSMGDVENGANPPGGGANPPGGGAAPLAPLHTHFLPSSYAAPSCIQLPPFTATHYEIKTSILNALPNFHGLTKEDPYQHIDEFITISSTLKIHNFPNEVLRLILFQFSLKENAKHWLSTLPANSITSWDQLKDAFLKKYFSIGKTVHYRKLITSFRQNDNEPLHEAWERYGNLIRKCPHHDIPQWQLVQCFYDGLNSHYRMMVDASCGGSLMNKNEQSAWELFETMSDTSQHQATYQHSDRATTAASSSKPRGLYEVSPSDHLALKVDSLAEKLDQFLSLGSTSTPPPPTFQEACSLCASPAHYVTECPARDQFPGFAEEQVHAAQGYSNVQSYPKPGDPSNNTYHPGLRNHPNLSWRQPQDNAPTPQSRPWSTPYNPAAYCYANNQQPPPHRAPARSSHPSRISF
jgi:hypothetical protein